MGLGTATYRLVFFLCFQQQATMDYSFKNLIKNGEIFSTIIILDLYINILMLDFFNVEH